MDESDTAPPADARRTLAHTLSAERFDLPALEAERYKPIPPHRPTGPDGLPVWHDPPGMGESRRKMLDLAMHGERR